MIIDGKKIAENILNNLKTLPKPKQFLGAVWVNDPSDGGKATLSFLKQKENIAKELGVDFRLYSFPHTIAQDELRKEVLKIASHKTCGGMIVQLPLPEHIDKHYVCNAIPREKDVDVLGERAFGAFYTDRNPILPPAVGVLQKILETVDLKLEASCVAVVGLGFLVGKPIATRLMGKCKELILLDISTDFAILKNADLIISGVGKAGLIKQDMLKSTATIIDFGYSVASGKISGDFDISSVSQTASYTPTPGGTGPILVAELFENFYTLNTF